MIYLLLLLVMGCNPEPSCNYVDEFVDKWWQIKIAANPVGNCYLFASNGDIVEKNSENVWISDTWEYEEFEDCSFEIYNPEATLFITEYKEDCWQIEYEGYELKACECQL